MTPVLTTEALRPPARFRAGAFRRTGRILAILALALACGAGAARAQTGDAGEPAPVVIRPAAAHMPEPTSPNLLPVVVRPGPARPGVLLRVADAAPLVRLFDRLDYSYSEAGEAVPRIFVAALPRDMDAIRTQALRERVFLGALLPLVLRVDEAVARDRVRLLGLRNWIAAGNDASAADLRWLGALAAAYELDPPDLAIPDSPDRAEAVGDAFAALLERVDIVPPSMALAQAAIETGMGTSNLARSHNALFGQTGVGSGTGYASFERLQDSVAAYVRNLNTHPAYEPFRALRAEQRLMGERLDGYSLMAGLQAYSIRRDAYIDDIRRFIETRGLLALDRARLASPVARAALRSAL